MQYFKRQANDNDHWEERLRSLKASAITMWLEHTAGLLYTLHFRYYFDRVIKICCGIPWRLEIFIAEKNGI